MDFNTIEGFISSVGFPIVVSGAMGYFIWFLTTKFKTSMDALTLAVNSLISQLQGQDTQILNQIKQLANPTTF